MKKLLSILLVLLMLTACAEQTAAPTTGAQNLPTETMPQESLEAVEPVEVENPVTSLYLSMNRDETDYFSLTAYADGEGGAVVEMVADVKKVATLPSSALHGIADALAKSGLEALNGQNVYEEGTSSGSVYVEYADGTMLAAGFSGTLPDAFCQGYDAMELYFKRLLKDEPVYVPKPLVEGDVDAALLEEMLDVLEKSGIQELDGFFITAVARDEYMTTTLGLSDITHIASAAACSPMMQPNAYSFVVVQVDDDANMEAVREDFAANLSWNKWVCVSATNALIAQKGDLVLCLMGTGTAFGQTSKAIENAGWEAIQTYKAN